MWVIGAVMGLSSIEKQQNRKPDCPETLHTADRLVSNRRGSADAGLWCVVLGGSKALGSNETSVTSGNSAGLTGCDMFVLTPCSRQAVGRHAQDSAGVESALEM
jgi:hypothetical protein